MKITKEWLDKNAVGLRAISDLKEYFDSLTNGEPAEVSDLLCLFNAADKFYIGNREYDDRSRLLNIFALAASNSAIPDGRYIKLLAKLIAAEEEFIDSPKLIAWCKNPVTDNPEELRNVGYSIVRLHGKPSRKKEMTKLDKDAFYAVSLRLEDLLYACRSDDFDSVQVDFEHLFDAAAHCPNTRKVFYGALVEFFDGVELIK